MAIIIFIQIRSWQNEGNKEVHIKKLDMDCYWYDSYRGLCGNGIQKKRLLGFWRRMADIAADSYGDGNGKKCKIFNKLFIQAGE